MKKKQKIDYHALSLVVIAIFHIIILLKGIFFPYPELVVYPYLTNIGLTPYAQILDQHFPGLMFFPINLNNLGFTTPADFRLLQVLIILATHLLMFFIAKSITKSEKTAILANILYFAMQPFLEGNVLWIDSFLPLVFLPAYYFLTNLEKKENAFLAGLFLGLSVLFKQVAIPLGLLTAVYLFIFRKRDKAFFPFMLGAGVPALALLVFVLRNNIWNDFVYWAGTFNLTAYAEGGRKFATFRQILAAGVFYLPAILLSFWSIILGRKKMVFLALFLWGSLLFAYPRFDYVHLQPSLPFAILLVVSFFSIIPEKLRANLFILYLIPVIWVSSRFFVSSIGSEVKFFGETEYKVADKITQMTSESDPIFMYGTLPHMYQLANRRPAGNIFVFQFPWFMRVAEERVLEGIRSDPPRVIVKQASASIDGESLFSYMRRIDGYISENYEKIEEIEGFEILVPK